MIENTAFLILAAGASKRMGTPKQLLSFKTDVLLTHAIKQVLQVSTENVFVVLGANYKSILKKIRSLSVNVIEHKEWEKGIGSSIAFGVSQIQQTNKYKRVMLLLADQPNIKADDLQQILRHHFNNKNKITVTACYNYTGVPVVFEHYFFKELTLLSSDNGAKSILKKYESIVSDFLIEKEIVDIDTPEDYDKMLKSLKPLL
ncbi:molybdenum cofactor cytidylyltransferase [Wenyingzhuangia heitensis]|uniref:Molybdenum cofactor cytidylyltransferase n=1 Tax=Wenyingzhuangia heitensis TaxID=1487859 RepID=A0ABX0UA38_9FLAO|nr:nucleotidyltransferase family protein [Wenyingzhuangia heitensis]NIJ44026.1 molybdenum cofactor cytidylyltransferase [Wenyingzhuangia heitensis]